MRIDYSPPRRSTTGASAAGKQRSPGNSSLRSVAVIAVAGSMIFSVGFGTGWYFSQQATKRAFRAAMEQNSLESAPQQQQQPTAPASVPSAATPAATPPVTAAPAPVPGTVPAPPQKPAAAPTPTPAGPPLSFYENLPSGQKNTVLGSGINEKPKPAPAVSPPAASPPPQKPAEAPAPSPQPAASPTTAPAGWVVQVAAFSSQKEAEALKAKLAAKGYSASVMETSLNDKGTWYRVRIGRHMTKEAATDIASRIGGGAKALPDHD